MTMIIDRSTEMGPKMKPVVILFEVKRFDAGKYDDTVSLSEFIDGSVTIPIGTRRGVDGEIVLRIVSVRERWLRARVRMSVVRVPGCVG